MRRLFRVLSIGSFFSPITIISVCCSGCVSRSGTLSSKGYAEAEPSPEAYYDYEGEYQLAPDSIITVTKNRDKLYCQAAGQQKIEICPESEIRFLYREVDSKIVFNRNKDGIVESLTLFQNGREMPAKKI